MSIYEKMQKMEINIKIDEFINFINYYYENISNSIEIEINLITSEKFGETFNKIWNLANFEEKIEIILLLKNSNLFNFFDWKPLKIFMNKLNVFIEKEGYEIKKK